MKKTTRPTAAVLQLTTSTIRTLSAVALRDVAGGQEPPYTLGKARCGTSTC